MGQQPGAGGMRAPLVGESAKRPKRPRRDLANPCRQDRLIAVGLFDTLQFAGENIERLLPADPDSFIPATKRLVAPTGLRSEQHTSALPSLIRISYAVFSMN